MIFDDPLITEGVEHLGIEVVLTVEEYMAMQSKRRLEMTPVEQLVPAPRNPKTHDGPSLEASLGRFGYADPIVVDERTGRVVSGHGRREALIALKSAGKPPPTGVEVAPDGAWLVPVLRGWGSRDDAEAEAFLIAANRIGEAGGWDDRALTDMLRELAQANPVNLEGTGFDAQQVAALAFVTRPAGELADMNAASQWVGLPAYEEGGNPIKLVINFKTEEDRKRFVDETQLRMDILKGTTWSTRWPWVERLDKAAVAFQGQE